MISLAGIWAARKTVEGSRKIRLWTSYFLILCVVVLGSLSITNYVKQVKMERAYHTAMLASEQQKTAITLLQSVNDQQNATIDRINQIRAADGEILTGLQNDLANRRKRDGALNEKLNALERNYAEVRDFMRRPVPVVPGGGCVLDDSCEATDSEQDNGDNAPQVTSPKVPAPATGKSPRAAGLHHQQQCPAISLRWLRCPSYLYYRLG